MFPYQYGNEPMGTPGGLGMGIVPLVFGGRHDLPEEVRAALEERQNEIHSEEDMRRIVNELMMRQ